MTSKTFYQILQVDPAASVEVIEAAYRRLARMYHPDVNRSAEAVQQMQQLNDGIYQLYYKTGAYWNGQEFLQPQSAEKFEDTFPFDEDSPGWVVTLYPTSEGTASTKEVDEDEFPPIAVE